MNHTRASWKDCAKLKIYALSVLGKIGSTSAPDGATIKDKAYGFQCTAAGPYNTIQTNLLSVGSVCALDPTCLGSILSASRPVIEPPPTQAHFPTVWQKLRQLASMISSHFCPQLRMEGEVLESFQGHVAATALLRDELQKQDFARPVSLRVSRILGPVSRFSHGTDSAPDETCVTFFSPWALCSILAHPLQWTLYGTKISC